MTLTQQLIMTPQLQQAIKLLQLSRIELANMIQQEMEENPALEESFAEIQHEKKSSEDDRSSDNNDETIKEVTIEEKVRDDIDWTSYINEYNSTGKIYAEVDHQEAINYEAFTSNKETLKSHLQWQLLMSGPSSEEEQIGSMIIGNLDLDGYLCSSIEEISEAGHFNPHDVAKLLTKMQGFDPMGVCARNLQESLLIQIKQLGIETPLLKKIISGYMKNLENKTYKKISDDLKISLDNVVSAIKIIQCLEPKPGRKFATDEPHYIIPDIYVYREGDDFKVVMNDDGLPKLRINSLYRTAVAKGKELPKETKAYLNEKMQSASWLIKSIHQRQKTIYSVMESIIKFQKDFFLKGIAYLKPMILKDVAEDIKMHESTISRVTTNKYAYTPQGLFELKYFFNSSINRVNGDSLASESVKDKIRLIIKNEDPKNPYSDEKLSELLKKANIKIARRTITKYREMLHILPSTKRKQF